MTRDFHTGRFRPCPNCIARNASNPTAINTSTITFQPRSIPEFADDTAPLASPDAVSSMSPSADRIAALSIVLTSASSAGTFTAIGVAPAPMFNW